MHLNVRILGPAKEYIESLEGSEQGTIRADIETMQSGDFNSVHTKHLRNRIRELIVGGHRITYFQTDNKLYFVRGFRKKSAKTPRKEIEYAEKIYNVIIK